MVEQAQTGMTEAVMEVEAARETAWEMVAGTEERAGKYLTFFLADEEYGLEILKVQEIIGMMDVTPVPRTPDFIKGVINLRGKVIPVVELRTKFEMATVDYTEETCIIVVEVMLDKEAMPMGVLVDAVSEVLDIGEEQVEPTPSFGGSIQHDFILGMAKIDEQVKILLNIEKVLTNEEMEILNNSAPVTTRKKVMEGAQAQG